MTDQDRELLVRVDERVKSFDARLTEIATGLETRLKAQDKKISSLPQWQHVAAALFAAFTALGGGIVKLLLDRQH